MTDAVKHTGLAQPEFFKMACLSFTDTQSARRFGYFLWQMNVYAEKRQDLAAILP